MARQGRLAFNDLCSVGVPTASLPRTGSAFGVPRLCLVGHFVSSDEPGILLSYLNSKYAFAVLAPASGAISRFVPIILCSETSRF